MLWEGWHKPIILTFENLCCSPFVIPFFVLYSYKSLIQFCLSKCIVVLYCMVFCKVLTSPTDVARRLTILS